MRLSSHEGGGGWPGGVGGMPSPPFGTALSMFGDGSYSGNIIQGGSVLQPQDYNLVGAKVPLTAGMLSATGNIGAWNASQMIDGSVASSQGSYVNISAAPGSGYKVDLGTAAQLSKFRLYRCQSTAPYGWVVKYSDDGVTYYNAAGSVAMTLAVGWNDLTFTETATHRYWWVCTTLTADSANQWQPEIEAYYGESFTNAIVVTGAATVAPDVETGASVFTAWDVIVDGGSLAPSTNSKGLIGFISGSMRCINGGRVHVDYLGKAGNFGNLTAYALAPDSIKRKLKKSALDAYVVRGEGAAGGAPVTGSNVAGNAGAAAAAMQSGGGGTGGIYGAGTTGKGGKGGPCSGGAGSGGSWGGTALTGPDAGDHGGPGGNGWSTGYNSPGGGGNPVGTGVFGGNAGQGAGGGLLMLFSPSVSIASGCSVSADGAKGGAAGSGGAGGSTGGGIVCIVTQAGGYSNAGTVRASGGASQPAGQGVATGGAGGAGSVNILTAA